MLITLSLAASIGLAQVSTAFPTALRSHIEYLSDHGIIQTPISSWPLDSASIQQSVEACIEQPQQTPAVLEQCLVVKQAFNKKKPPHPPPCNRQCNPFTEQLRLPRRRCSC